MNPFDVTIAGEINLDLILYGFPAEIPVERELLASGFQATLGSSSAILAHNLSILGARVGFVTCSGNDELGRMALRRLAASGVDLSRAITHPSTSTGVTVLLPHGETRHILTYPGTIATLTLEDLDIEYLKSSRHFHLSSLYLQSGLAPEVPKLLRELKSAGLTLSLDTNDDPDDRWGPPLEEILPLVDLFFPNEDELRRMTGRQSLESALEAISAEVSCVAVKRGRAGSVVRTREGIISAPPLPVRPVDTIGAGDSFDAGFLFAWLHGCGIEECARAGNITGALSTLRAGGTAAFCEPQFVAAFLDEHKFPAPATMKE